MYIILTTIENKPVKIYVRDFKHCVEIENYTLVITRGMNFKVKEKPDEIEGKLMYGAHEWNPALKKHKIKIH